MYIVHMYVLEIQEILRLILLNRITLK